MPNTYAASPVGIEARKENYSADGRLCIIAAAATRIDATTPCLNYRIDGDQRIVTDSDGEDYAATFKLPDPDTLVVTQEGGSVWRYVRLIGAHAIANTIEPVSVEALKTARSFPATHYDTQDYSSLPLAKRLIGAWEVVAYENMPMADAPPNGAFNDIWMFDGTHMTSIRRPLPGPTSPTLDPLSYTVKGNTLEIDNMPRILIDFNHWGHLTLVMDGEIIRLKLISKDSAHAPLPPLKIALMRVDSDDAAAAPP
ncbi:MAG TPA: hypothetical protein VFN09_15945 [Rhodanobacteraceae bacterium]|nr:hypothetical protein [Rhodanobacteraceae bacterium]